MNALLDYDTSPLNPAIKIIIPVTFFAIFLIYLYTRKYYTEKIRTFIDILLLFALFAVIAGIFRYFGDGTLFGFTKEYSLKWVQSLAMLAGAACFGLAGYKLLHLFKEDRK